MDFSSLRTAMVASQLRTNAITNRALITALENVPREDFVPADRQALAYIDVAIPLGNGRAMPAPLSTARLIQEAGIVAGQKVMLIGGGTGYAAALLDAMGAKVVMVEEDARLAKVARAALSETSVEILVSPLALGAPAHAPFDAAIIDGAIEFAPPELLEQMSDGAIIATGFVEHGVTRVAVARVGNGQAAFTYLLDLEFPVLTGFARAKGFAF